MTGDPDAAVRLAQDLGMRLPLQLNRSLVSYLRGRTEFFDGQVVEATASPPRQIVIIGAGYDDRALRFRSPGVRFIEVDLPSTQHDKQRRLGELKIDSSDIHFVPVDLEAGGVGTDLDRALDPTLPTTIICEAVIPYLRRPTVEALLLGLRNCAGSSVRLAVDLPTLPTRRAGRVALALLRAATAAAGEHIRTVVDAEEVSPLLENAGLVEHSRISGQELGISAAAAGTLLFVVADDGTRLR